MTPGSSAIPSGRATPIPTKTLCAIALLGNGGTLHEIYISAGVLNKFGCGGQKAVHLGAGNDGHPAAVVHEFDPFQS